MSSAEVASPRPPDRSDRSTSDNATSSGSVENNRDRANEPFGVDLLAILQAAESRNQTFIAAIQRSSWQASLKAYRSQHPENSKYRSDAYKHRTKLFRPKTRAAVRKNVSAAAAALFSNADVVSIKPQYDSNPVKNASAAVLHETLNYRLDRTTGKAGVPWFLMAMGGCMDAQIHGICLSKQYWEYETVNEPYEEEQNQAVLDEATGQPMIDDTGAPIVQKVTVQKVNVRRIKDRPMCLLLPPENHMLDPAAPWHDPIQSSAYFTAIYPMTVDQARTMLANPGKGGEQWLPVDDAVLKACTQDYTAKGVRTARAGGVDRYDNRGSDGTGAEVAASNIVWMYENFMRIAGQDYHFWTVGTRVFASKVRKTEEAYPEQFGDRPYTYGYGAIEPHQIFPMSPVESWRNLQNEINEQVNLRTDILKQALSPIAKVRQGTIFDWKQMQRRGGPDATVIVNKMDDLEFETPPSPTGASYSEMAHLNADFDDISGSFSPGSVQTNRQLNETVGGMRLMSGAANAVTEYDLRIWVETWVEPTLRQIVRCIQYYEDDQTILAVAGERARMMERFGIEQITDEDLLEEVSVRVNVGTGAVDPMQRLQKLGAAMEMIANAAPFFDKPVKLNAEEFIKEAIGAAGYNDGSRFFTFVEPDQKQDPQVLEAQIDAEVQRAKIAMEERVAMAGQANDMAIERMKAIIGMLDDFMGHRNEIAKVRKKGQIDSALKLADAFVERMKPQPEPKPGAGARLQ